jgi:hypothetical protein
MEMHGATVKAVSLWSPQCMVSEFFSLSFALGYIKYPPCRRMCQIRVVSLVGRENSFLNSSIKFDASVMKRGDYILSA